MDEDTKRWLRGRPQDRKVELEAHPDGSITATLFERVSPAFGWDQKSTVTVCGPEEVAA